MHNYLTQNNKGQIFISKTFGFYSMH